MVIRPLLLRPPDLLFPALQNPLALGADLVLHSCTKYLNGHSDVVAGVVIAKDPDVVTELAWWANNIGVTGGAFDSYLLLRVLRTLTTRTMVKSPRLCYKISML